MKPKISIVTVTYNCKEQLKATISSVVSQTYLNIEFIIIDGASSDGTTDIIKENETIINYWISESDKGIYDAMNKGLKAATGDYILFLNAGDTFYNRSTLEDIPFAENPDTDIFYGETLIKNENGETLGLRRKSLPADLNWKHFKKGMVVCHQSILVSKKIARPYDLTFKYSADIDWVLNALRDAKKIVFTKTIISGFVTGGFSAQNKWGSWLERWVILKMNFGLLQCILSHIVFIFELLVIKLKLKPGYRKIDPKLLTDEEAI